MTLPAPSRIQVDILDRGRVEEKENMLRRGTLSLRRSVVRRFHCSKAEHAIKPNSALNIQLSKAASLPHRLSQ